MHGLPPLTKGTSLAAFANTLRVLGAPVESALRRAKLPLHYEERLDAWVSYRALRCFVADLAAREALDDLGARAARSSSEAGIHPALRAAVYCAPTLFHALRVLTRVVGYQVTGLRVWIEPVGENLCLCHEHPLGLDCPGYDINESYRTYQLVAMIRRFLGPKWLPERVIARRCASSRTAPPSVPPFAEVGVAVRAHPDHGGIEIPTHLAWRPNLRPAPSAPSEGSSDPGTSFAAVLRSCLAPYVLDGNPSLELGAEIMGMSTRRLQRRLAAEHTSFRRVTSLARLDGALSDLRAPDLPLIEIALRMGYSEQSAFSRAFRSWMGMCPHAYRARLLAQPEGHDLPSPPRSGTGTH